MKAKTKFIMGNCLRGYFEGEFPSMEKAWDVLSQRFMLSYPTPEGGRFVQMYLVEENRFGFKQEILCKEGYTIPGVRLTSKHLRRVAIRSCFS